MNYCSFICFTRAQFHKKGSLQSKHWFITSWYYYMKVRMLTNIQQMYLKERMLPNMYLKKKDWHIAVFVYPWHQYISLILYSPFVTYIIGKLLIWKLDGVGHVDNRPSTEKTQQKKLDMWHVTRDTWHVTRDTWNKTHDMWHVKCDTWPMTGEGRWTFSQKFCSLAFKVWEWRFDKDIFSKDDWVS